MSRILRVFGRIFRKLLSRLMGRSSVSSDTNDNADANSEAYSFPSTETENAAPINIAAATDETEGTAMETDYFSMNDEIERESDMDNDYDTDVSMSDLPTWNNMPRPVSVTLQVNLRGCSDQDPPTLMEVESEPDLESFNLLFSDNEPPSLFYSEYIPEFTPQVTDVLMHDLFGSSTDTTSDTSNTESYTPRGSDMSIVASSQTSTTSAATDTNDTTSFVTLTNTIDTSTIDTALNNTINTPCLDLNSVKLRILMSRFPFQNFLVDLRTNALKQTNKQRLTLREYTDLRRIARRQWFQLPNHIKIRYSPRAAQVEQRAITDRALNAGCNQEEDQEKENTNDVNHNTENETEHETENETKNETEIENKDFQREEEKQEDMGPSAEDNVTPMDVDEYKETSLPATSSSCANRKRQRSSNHRDESVAQKRNRVAASNGAHGNPVPSQDSVNASTPSLPSNSNDRTSENGNFYKAWLDSPARDTDEEE